MATVKKTAQPRRAAAQAKVSATRATKPKTAKAAPAAQAKVSATRATKPKTAKAAPAAIEAPFSPWQAYQGHMVNSIGKLVALQLDSVNAFSQMALENLRGNLHTPERPSLQALATHQQDLLQTTAQQMLRNASALGAINGEFLAATQVAVTQGVAKVRHFSL